MHFGIILFASIGLIAFFYGISNTSISHNALLFKCVRVNDVGLFHMEQYRTSVCCSATGPKNGPGFFVCIGRGYKIETIRQGFKFYTQLATLFIGKVKNAVNPSGTGLMGMA